jgi:ribonuclease BN (tRNA processing enzyme)
MKLVFLGVGDAFDEKRGNTSIGVINETRLLLDCGYLAPDAIWKTFPDPDFFDAIYLSHVHGDHTFGIPPYLTRMWLDRRTKPLKIIANAEVIEKLPAIIDLAYPGITKDYKYLLVYVTAIPGKTIPLNELELSFAPTIHPVKNLAIRIQTGDLAVCYSGDGQITHEAQELYQNADWLIQESFTLEPDPKLSMHGNVRETIKTAEACGIGNIALTHVERNQRDRPTEVLEFANQLAEFAKIYLPDPGDELTLEDS